MTTITVLMGIPGSGKSYWAKANNPDNTFLASNDPIRTQQIDNYNGFINHLRRQSLKHLEAGNDVIADGTHIDRADRLWWLRAANFSGSFSRLVVVQASIETCLKVQSNREHPVPDKVVRKYHNRMQEQLRLIRSESWNEIIYVTR